MKLLYCFIHFHTIRPYLHYPITIAGCSMYGIFTYICLKNGLNVGKYPIHGASGIATLWLFNIAMEAMAHFQQVNPGKPSISMGQRVSSYKSMAISGT